VNNRTFMWFVMGMGIGGVIVVILAQVAL